LLCNVAARDAELKQLKMLVEQLADKVNTPGDTPRTASPRWKIVSMR
jgi:hypothetical protein